MPSRHAPVRRVVAILLSGVACAALAGCTGEEPGLRPAPSTAAPWLTESATPTPTPTFRTPAPTPGVLAALPDGVKPERPAALDQAPTPEGAISVLEFYLQLFPYAQNTGDAQDLRALSHPECVFCASVIDGVDRLTARNEHAVGGGLTLTDATSTEVDPGRWFSVHLRMAEGPSQELSQSGTLIKDYPGTLMYDVEAAVVHDGSAWSVRELSHKTVDS
ncbi:DUF6318 family protein [Cellulomonas sp. URHB0016]